MEGTAITCDVCDIEKRTTNHWLEFITTAAPDIRGIAFAPMGTGVSDPAFKVGHLCGEACAHKRLSRWLDELKAASTTTNGKDR
jgi:hypothetical protein